MTVWYMELSDSKKWTLFDVFCREVDCDWVGTKETGENNTECPKHKAGVFYCFVKNKDPKYSHKYQSDKCNTCKYRFQCFSMTLHSNPDKE